MLCPLFYSGFFFRFLSVNKNSVTWPWRVNISAGPVWSDAAFKVVGGTQNMHEGIPDRHHLTQVGNNPITLQQWQQLHLCRPKPAQFSTHAINHKHRRLAGAPLLCSVLVDSHLNSLLNLSVDRQRHRTQWWNAKVLLVLLSVYFDGACAPLMQRLR